jgi:hypothetical protein
MMRTGDEKNNFRSLIIKDGFSVVSQTFSSVSIVQAFLMSIGFVSFQLGLLNTITNAALMLSAFIFMGRIDAVHPKRAISINSKLYLSMAILPLTLLLMSLLGVRSNTGVVFVIVAGAWAAQSFFAGIKGIIDSRVCQIIFRPESYGSIFGIDGIVANLLGIAGGVMIPQVIDRINEGNGYGAVFALALLFLPGAVIFSGRMRSLREDKPKEALIAKTPIGSFSHAFNDKLMRNISWLHIVRGIINGMFIFIFPLGVSYYGLPLYYAAYIVIVTQGASIIANIIVNISYDKIGTVKSMLVATVLCLVATAGFIAFRSPGMFLVSLTFYFIGTTIVNQAVPIGIFKVVPEDSLGTLTGVRFIIMQTAEAIIAFIMGIILANIAIPLFFSIIAVLLLIQFWFSNRSFSITKPLSGSGGAGKELNHIR